MPDPINPSETTTPYEKIPPPPENDPRWDKAARRLDSDKVWRRYHQPTQTYWVDTALGLYNGLTVPDEVQAALMPDSINPRPCPSCDEPRDFRADDEQICNDPFHQLAPAAPSPIHGGNRTKHPNPTACPTCESLTPQFAYKRGCADPWHKDNDRCPTCGNTGRGEVYGTCPDTFHLHQPIHGAGQEGERWQVRRGQKSSQGQVLTGYIGPAPDPQSPHEWIEVVPLQALEEARAELCECQNCGHRQAEPNWCHKCGHRTSHPEWAAELLRSLADERARVEDLDQALEELRAERDDYLEQLLGRPCVNCDGSGEVMGHDPSSANASNPDGEYDDQCSVCGGTGREPSELSTLRGEVERAGNAVRSLADRLTRARERSGADPFDPNGDFDWDRWNRYRSAIDKTEHEAIEAASLLSPTPQEGE